MAKIVEYDATIAQDKITPTNTGYSATEMAARRIASFAEQEAAGAKEIGALQAKVTDDAGIQATAFLRLQGLEASGGGGGLKAGGGGRTERTLIGTGTNSGLTYNHLQEFHGGPSYLSRVARSAVANNNQMYWDNDLQQYVSNNSLSKERAYWDHINQQNMDKLIKDSPNPAKEMADIYKEADEAARDPDALAKQGPGYMGPGAKFNSTEVDTGINQDSGYNSYGNPSNDAGSNAGGNGWGGIWDQISAAVNSSSNLSADQ